LTAGGAGATFPAMDILVIGGSGFVSGTLAARARAAGHRVWALTRGRRPLAAGVTPLIGDRADDAAFAAVLSGAGLHWDLAVDCIGYNGRDAEQDLRHVAPLARHLVFISTDFVYDPARRVLDQPEDAGAWNTQGYGGLKREAERVFEAAGAGATPWTIVRPCHIYGPGSELGVLPAHSRDTRLLQAIAAGEPLRLVGGGWFLQQPVHVADLVDTILDLGGRASAYGRTLNVRGPDTVEAWRYYEIIGGILGAPVKVEEIPIATFARENPDKASFLSHRSYSIERLAATGARIPATPLARGLREHVAALQAGPQAGQARRG
jgi:nucleoside-diphosphate-sugar epimerase